MLQVTGDDDVWDGVVSVVFSVATASSVSWGSGLVSVSRSYVVGIEDDDAGDELALLPAQQHW